jgi:SAM-dependent methyltransferase
MTFEEPNEFGNFEVNISFLKQASTVDRKAEILEIGSGKGSLVNYLLERGYHIKGIEIDDEKLAHGKRLYGQLPVCKMSGDAIGFRDRTFDMVLSFDVLEHIPDVDKHLQEVRRVLKPNGWYLLQTPNKWTNAVFETIRWKSFSKWKLYPHHCSLHNYWQLKQRFKDNGFEIEIYNMPVVTDFFKSKMESSLGSAGLLLIRVINPDKLPLPLKTNFYVKAQKTD